MVSYLSISYYLAVLIILFLYYLVPGDKAWIVLLAASCLMTAAFAGRRLEVLLFFFTALVSWLCGRLLQKKKDKKILILGIAVTFLPFLAVRLAGVLPPESIIVPVGLSFYTLSILAYLADLYQGKMEGEKNFFRYFLFLSYFPKLIQGPICRYQEVRESLSQRKEFNPQLFQQGVLRIAWGLFLKLVIADRAGDLVNTVFGSSDIYGGLYIFIAAVFYSIQLYADFSGCVKMAEGVSLLFAIPLPENFQHPYRAVSMRGFWRGWHMTLSRWLRDYVYIPLGGSRRGKKRQYLNILVTFLVSGFWHGTGLQFVLWGCMHGLYQITGLALAKKKEHFYQVIGLGGDSVLQKALKVMGTFFWVTIAWIPFRAASFDHALALFKSMATVHNPWILTDGSLFRLGIQAPQMAALAGAVLVWIKAGDLEMQYGSLSERLSRKKAWISWAVVFLLAIVILLFGRYGAGYDAADFIYGGF
jgi:alginate O-acetyltransferase complex protein AlgI